MISPSVPITAGTTKPKRDILATNRCICCSEWVRALPGYGLRVFGSRYSIRLVGCVGPDLRSNGLAMIFFLFPFQKTNLLIALPTGSLCRQLLLDYRFPG